MKMTRYVLFAEAMRFYDSSIAPRYHVVACDTKKPELAASQVRVMARNFITLEAAERFIHAISDQTFNGGGCITNESRAEIIDQSGLEGRHTLWL